MDRLAGARQRTWDGLHVFPGAASSKGAKLCTYQHINKTKVYKDIKVAYGCEPYIPNCSNRHLQQIVAQFCTGSHWLNIETGRHRLTMREKSTCQLCNYRVGNSGLDAAHFDSFESDDDGLIPQRMSLMPLLLALAMCTPDSFCRILSANRSQP